MEGLISDHRVLYSTFIQTGVKSSQHEDNRRQMKTSEEQLKMHWKKHLQLTENSKLQTIYQSHRLLPSRASTPTAALYRASGEMFEICEFYTRGADVIEHMYNLTNQEQACKR